MQHRLHHQNIIEDVTFFLVTEIQKGIVFCNVIVPLQVSVSDSLAMNSQQLKTNLK